LANFEEQDRRAALKESLPGLLFGIFILLVTLVIMVWFAVK